MVSWSVTSHRIWKKDVLIVFYFKRVTVYNTHRDEIKLLNQSSVLKSKGMRIFQSFRVLFEPLGIGDAFKTDGINSKNVVAQFFLTFWTSLSYAFFLSGAEKTFSEFIQSFYISITTMINTLIFAIIVWKKSRIYKFIDDLEVLIEERKLTAITILVLRKKLNKSLTICSFFNWQRLTITILPNVSGYKNSESKKIYEKINERIEKWTKILYFVWMRGTFPGTMLPNCIISYFLYFATDLGSNAFRLPFPIWFVKNLSFSMCENHLYLVTTILKVAFRLANTTRVSIGVHRSICGCLLFCSSDHIHDDFLRYFVLDIDGHQWRYKRRHQRFESNSENQTTWQEAKRKTRWTHFIRCGSQTVNDLRFFNLRFSTIQNMVFSIIAADWPVIWRTSVNSSSQSIFFGVFWQYPASFWWCKWE